MDHVLDDHEYTQMRDYQTWDYFKFSPENKKGTSNQACATIWKYAVFFVICTLMPANNIPVCALNPRFLTMYLKLPPKIYSQCY